MSEWKTYKLGSLCKTIFSGGTPATTEPSYWNGDLLWLSSGETRNKYITSTEKYITQEGVDNSSTRLAQKHDIVMACAGQGNTRGQTSIILDDMYINQSVIAIRPKSDKLDYRFLFYDLTMRYDELRAISDASSTRGSITTEMLKKISISIPPLPTQTRIAEILSAYDDAIENNNRRIALLEKAARELYKEWFVRFRFPGHESVKFVNGLPEGWEIKPIKVLSDIKSGYAFKSEWWKTAGVPVIKIKDIQNNTIDTNNFDYVEQQYAIKAKKFYVCAGDLLIAMTGATIGKIALVPDNGKMLVNQRVGKFFIGNEPIKNVGYLYCFFRQDYIQEQILLLSSSNSAQPNISPDDLCNIKLIYNKKMIDNYNQSVYHIFAEIITIQSQSQNLVRQRDLLLPRLMSGKLEV